MTNPSNAVINQGRVAGELTDAELEQQGKAAHDTRNWVFLNGTAEQFANHTARMLELEQEYLRRHPKRTWQGSGGAASEESEVDVLLQALRAVLAQIETVLGQHALRTKGSQSSADSADPAQTLLARIAEQPGHRMHKLEVHQLAREVGLDRSSLARLYSGEPAMLTTDQADRVLTAAALNLIADNH